MASDRRVYENVNRQALTKLRGGLERAHVALPAGDQGEIASNGLIGSFGYDEATSTLVLTIEKYPMFIPKGIIWKAIDGAIADAKRP
ncbi:MAG: hypothetical protein ABR584_01885 [Candidatus Baltobacteraceae bacterium]